jgi:hypothetical protein
MMVSILDAGILVIQSRPERRLKNSLPGTNNSEPPSNIRRRCHIHQLQTAYLYIIAMAMIGVQRSKCSRTTTGTVPGTTYSALH